MENMASSSTGKRKLPLTLLFLVPLLLEFGLGTFFWSEVLPLYPFDHIIFGIVWLLAALFTIPFLVLKKGRWELLVLFVLLLGIELLAASAALWGPDYGSNDIWSDLSTEWHGAVHYEPRWTDWCAHSEECSNFGQDPLPFGTSTLIVVCAVSIRACKAMDIVRNNFFICPIFTNSSLSALISARRPSPC